MSSARYQIIRELGKGGMGKVYLVRDLKRPGQELALKALSFDNPDENFLLCFKAEFEILSTLDHPHLAKVFDFTNRKDLLKNFIAQADERSFAEGAEYFFTSEFVPGKDLYDSTENLNWREIAHLAMPLCRALSYIHSRGIVHRDLKPSNILVSDIKEGTLKVLDFGLARAQVGNREMIDGLSATSSSTLAGTLSYIAPENIRQEPIDLRADLYALGMIFYRIFTRISPFAGLPARQILQTHLQGIKTPPRQIVADIPRALSNLIMALLSPRVEDRPQDAGEVLSTLADLLGELAAPETLATSLGYVRSGKLVGREEILTRLHQRVNHLKNFSATLNEDEKKVNEPSLWISGEAGLGKRRLLREVERHCQLQGITFLDVPSYQEERPLETLRSILSGLLTILAENKIEALHLPEFQTLDRWLKREESEKKKSETDFAEDRDVSFDDSGALALRNLTRAFEIFWRYLERLFAFLPSGKLILHVPILVSHEGNSGEDKSTLIHQLAASLREHRLRFNLFLVITATPATPKPVKGDFEIQTLSPLTEPQTHELLQSMLGSSTLPEGLHKIVFQMTSGNPLHIEEVMRALVAEENLQREEGNKWHLRVSSPQEIAKLAVPEKIHETIGKRLQKLSSDERQVLQAAALFSGSSQSMIDPVALQAVLKSDLTLVLRVLEQLRVAGWFEGGENFKYQFVSPTSAKVVSEQLDSNEAKRLHAAIALYLESSLHADAASLAYHYDRAQLPEKAIHYLIEAGTEASGHYAPKEALYSYSRAAEYLALLVARNTKIIWEEKKWFVDEQIARLLLLMGDQKGALEKYENLAKRFVDLPLDQLPGPKTRSRMMRYLGHTYRGVGRPQQSLEAYEKALALLGRDAKGSEGALLLLQRAGVKARMGHRAQARQDCNFALKRIDSQREPLIYAVCYSVLGELEFNSGNLTKAQEYFNRALSAYERIEDRGGIANVLTYLGSLWNRKGNHEEAETLLRRAVREAQTIGEVKRVAMARNNLGSISFRRGDYQTAMREYLAGVEAARKLADRRLLATSLGNLGGVSRQRGAYGKALSYYQESLQLKTILNDPRSLCHTLLELADLEIYIGDVTRATPRVQEALHLARKTGTRDLEAQAVLMLGVLARLTEDHEMMNRRFQEAREIYQSASSKLGERMVDLECCRSLTLVDAQKLLPAVLAFAIEKGIRDLEIQAYLVWSDLGISEEVALSYLTLALKLARVTGNQEMEWEAAFRLGGLLRKTNSTSPMGSGFHLLNQARDILSEIVSGLSTEEKEIFLQNPLRKACFSTALPTFAQPEKSAQPDVKEHTIADLDGATSFVGGNRFFKLLEINKQLNSFQKLDELLEQILDAALELLSGERGFILTNDSGLLRIRTARQLSREELRDPENEVSMSIAKKVVEGGEPVIAVDALNTPEFSESVSVHALKLRSVLCVPLRAREGVLGALYIDNPKKSALFSHEDTDLLLLFADQAALAFEQARMRKQLSEQLERTHHSLVTVREELDQARKQLVKEFRFGQIIGGKDPVMDSLFSLMKKVANGTSPVLILGESGTGKELVARAIYSQGPLAKAAFYTVNCSAFPEGLLESELFGHESGAFTGAAQKKIGLFEAANGGTIFLDEIGEMSPAMQAKLLRVLESGEMRRVGGNEILKVSVRLICATHRDLAQAIKNGQFRSDLMYRINTITLTLPPLRERPNDFPLLVDHIMRVLRKRFRSNKLLSRRTMRHLEKYHWPGNVRELSNVLERAYTIAEGAGNQIKPEDLPEEVLQASYVQEDDSDADKASLEEVQSHASRSYLLELLEKTKGNVSRACRESGIPRATFYRLMRRHGVQR